MAVYKRVDTVSSERLNRELGGQIAIEAAEGGLKLRLDGLRDVELAHIKGGKYPVSREHLEEIRQALNLKAKGMGRWQAWQGGADDTNEAPALIGMSLGILNYHIDKMRPGEALNPVYVQGQAPVVHLPEAQYDTPEMQAAHVNRKKRLLQMAAGEGFDAGKDISSPQYEEVLASAVDKARKGGMFRNQFEDRLQAQASQMKAYNHLSDIHQSKMPHLEEIVDAEQAKWADPKRPGHDFEAYKASQRPAMILDKANEPKKEQYVQAANEVIMDLPQDWKTQRQVAGEELEAHKQRNRGGMMLTAVVDGNEVGHPQYEALTREAGGEEQYMRGLAAKAKAKGFNSCDELVEAARQRVEERNLKLEYLTGAKDTLGKYRQVFDEAGIRPL